MAAAGRGDPGRAMQLASRVSGEPPPNSGYSRVSRTGQVHPQATGISAGISASTSPIGTTIGTIGTGRKGHLFRSNPNLGGVERPATSFLPHLPAALTRPSADDKSLDGTQPATSQPPSPSPPSSRPALPYDGQWATASLAGSNPRISSSIKSGVASDVHIRSSTAAASPSQSVPSKTKDRPSAPRAVSQPMPSIWSKLKALSPSSSLILRQQQETQVGNRSSKSSPLPAAAFNEGFGKSGQLASLNEGHDEGRAVSKSKNPKSGWLSRIFGRQ